MRSKGNAPNAAQKRWLEAVAGLGSIISGGPAEIHHCVGVTGKHNKVAIGHEWIIPLTPSEHLAIHRSTLRITEWTDRKSFEKEAFTWVCTDLRGHKDMPAVEVIEAIADYRR